MPTLKYKVVTIFPEIFYPYLNVGVIGKAKETGKIVVEVYNLRDFTPYKHRQVDDYIYGGGEGMLLMPEPLAIAVEKLKTSNEKVILFSPRGKTLNTKLMKSLLENNWFEFILVCGRYEGVDARFIDLYVDMEVSLGDFVVSGGELPAIAFIDAYSRYVGNVIEESAVKEESFSIGLLEYDHYTRPQKFKGIEVPSVLISGNHKKIKEWRRYSALRNTYLYRPDLFKNVPLTLEDLEMLKDIMVKEKGIKI